MPSFQECGEVAWFPSAGYWGFVAVRISSEIGPGSSCERLCGHAVETSLDYEIMLHLRGRLGGGQGSLRTS